MRDRLGKPIAVLALLALASCTGRDGGEERRFELRGKVVSFDADAGTVLVEHGPVEGLMEGMTMPFPVKDRWVFGSLEAGDRLDAILVVRGREHWLEDLVISRSATPDADAPPMGPKPGDAVPDVELTNQSGEPIRLADYRGKAVAITFIYTRCPLADFCPRMTHHFGVVETELRADLELYARTHLLTISFDPAYDTPEKLAAYARQQALVEGETLEHWDFAAASPEKLSELASFFGLEYRNAEDQIVHNLRTAVVAPGGRVAKVFNGNQWQPDELLAALRETIAESAP